MFRKIEGMNEKDEAIIDLLNSEAKSFKEKDLLFWSLWLEKETGYDESDIGPIKREELRKTTYEKDLKDMGIKLKVKEKTKLDEEIKAQKKIKNQKEVINRELLFINRVEKKVSELLELEISEVTKWFLNVGGNRFSKEVIDRWLYKNISNQNEATEIAKWIIGQYDCKQIIRVICSMNCELISVNKVLKILDG